MWYCEIPWSPKGCFMCVMQTPPTTWACLGGISTLISCTTMQPRVAIQCVHGVCTHSIQLTLPMVLECYAPCAYLANLPETATVSWERTAKNFKSGLLNTISSDVYNSRCKYFSSATLRSSATDLDKLPVNRFAGSIDFFKLKRSQRARWRLKNSE
eukprot:m.209146 g.209146  ORF g.209146 m.209146 type:complete len:156 (-) comp15043_c5_seq1:422-889(-)